MLYPLSRITGATYRRVVKPVLFRFAADSVHEAMIRSGARIQRVTPLLALSRTALRYDNPILRQTVADVEFASPLGLSAGLDKDAQIVKLAAAIGFGFSECGSVTLHPYAGNPRPWYTRLPNSRSILVNAGLKSQGAAAVIDRIKHTYSPDFLATYPLNISIAKTNSPQAASTKEAIADYVECFRLFEAANVARLYTLNISCPNTYGGEPFTTPELLEQLLSALAKLKLTKPLFVKLPIDKSWHDTEALLDVAARYPYVVGITIGNLRKDRRGVDLRDPLSADQKGNLSGLPCREPSNHLLAHAYLSFGDRFVFSGVGGVFSAEDAYAKIRLGASLVEMVTGVIFGGPSIAGEINRGLARCLQTDGFDSIQQAIGIDAKTYINDHTHTEST